MYSNAIHEEDSDADDIERKRESGRNKEATFYHLSHFSTDIQTPVSIHEESQKKGLNEQQWMHQRMKIGLKTLPPTKIIESSTGYKMFIQTFFKRKECVKYIAESSAGDLCKCGNEKRNHKTIVDLNAEDEKLFGVQVLSNQDAELEEDNVTNHIQEFPTNAYGKIEFEGGQIGKYVRLADNTKMKKVKEFIFYDSSLVKPKPCMALSIIGGNKNFKLDGRKRETFKKGVIAAAQATNAWIISGGTNTGCMKLIGQIVKEGQFLVSEGVRMRKGIRTIGICSWGFIANSELLINPSIADKVLTPDGLKSIQKVAYNSDLKMSSKPTLDPNHFRFFLVDDGCSRNHMDSGSGGVVKFRADFENMIRKQEPQGMGIPILTLLLEGGTDAIHELKSSLSVGKSCVIIEGSGRAADILAYAFKNAVRVNNKKAFSLEQSHIEYLEKMLEESFGDKIRKDNRKEMLMKCILELINHSDRITIFDINSDEDIDKKILGALLKDKSFTVESKLMMSLKWDRPDIAEEMIFNNPNRKFKWGKRPFDNVMSQALLSDKVEFVKMLIVNGFSLKWFLTVRRLRDLYNEAASLFPELLDQLELHVGHDRAQIYLHHISSYLAVIMKRHNNSLYDVDKTPAAKNPSEKFITNSANTFEDPNFEMFTWAILTNRTKLAEFFWARTDHPVVAAVFAASLYGFLHHDMYQNRTTGQRLYDMKQHYLGNANSIMELAYNKDRDKAIELVDRKFERFGNICLLDMAFNGHLKSFIANSPCNDAIRGIWMLGFVKLPKRWAMLAIFLPFLVLTSKFKFLPLGDEGGELSIWQKLYVFYKAPRVKYLGHAVNYTIFLFLYTSTALFHFNWEFNLIEISVYVWLLTFIADEIREIMRQPSKKLTSKIGEHLEGFWNKLDLIIYALAVAGFVLKNWSETFGVSRVLFASNAFLLYARFFRFYHSSLKLGPKLVILHRMLPEIASFLLLIVIFILGYGTAREALLNSYNNFNASYVPGIINDVCFIPIWEMLGELNVEDISPSNEEVCYEETGSYDAFITGNQETVASQDGVFCENFTSYEPVVKIFLAFYMLIANVMLLNLLIAVFTTIFSHVQENSKIVWRYEEYRLLEEFSTKPFLAPPLVIFELLNRLLRHIWLNIHPQEKENLDILFSGMLKSLDLFEKDCSNSHEKMKMLDNEGKIETKLNNIERRLREIETCGRL